MKAPKTTRDEIAEFRNSQWRPDTGPTSPIRTALLGPSDDRQKAP